MGRTWRRRVLKRHMQRTAQDVNPFSVYVPELLEYLNNNGWKNETKLTIRSFPKSGRGLTITKKSTFTPGSELFRMPVKCLVSMVTMNEDDHFKSLFKNPECPESDRVAFHSLMAFYLLYHAHKGDLSPLYGYVNSLPDSFSNPFFCSLHEKRFLPIELLQKLRDQSVNIIKDYTFLTRILKESEEELDYFADAFSITEFKWAYFVVNTRSVYLDPSKFDFGSNFFRPFIFDEPNLALAPFLDLFNHSADVNTVIELKTNAASELEYVLTWNSSICKIHPNREIFINYGSLDNHKLFLDYGFILPNKLPDYFPISINDFRDFLKPRNIHNFLPNFVDSSKFRFIVDHNFDNDMYYDVNDGLSYNLHAVFHLLFKERSSFPNVLSRVAYGGYYQDCKDEACLLIAHKITEYLNLIEKLMHADELTRSGIVAVQYLRNCIDILEKCGTKI